MRLNNCTIAASYDTARIFTGLGFGTHRGGAVSSTRQCSTSVPSQIVSDRIGHANFAADDHKSVHIGMKTAPGEFSGGRFT